MSMNDRHYPGIGLKKRLDEAGLLTQFGEAVRARDRVKMKELLERVAVNQDEAQQFIGVVFANPEHYEKVISDRHYNGKTVSERLASEGLLDQFHAAVQAQDAAQVVELLEQVAITNSWAKRLANMMLEGARQEPIQLKLEDPRNVGLRHVPNERKYPPCIRPVESPRDPYWYLGSHPESVERVWDQLGSALPQDCRCIVFGTPGLVAPKSGILLAKAFGTAYILRLPDKTSVAEALQAGARIEMTWSHGPTTNLQEEYGTDWVFGRWLKQEPRWLSTVYQAVEQHHV
jgi:hypothetical protein